MTYHYMPQENNPHLEHLRWLMHGKLIPFPFNGLSICVIVIEPTGRK